MVRIPYLSSMSLSRVLIHRHVSRSPVCYEEPILMLVRLLVRRLPTWGVYRKVHCPSVSSTKSPFRVPSSKGCNPTTSLTDEVPPRDWTVHPVPGTSPVWVYPYLKPTGSLSVFFHESLFARNSSGTSLRIPFTSTSQERSLCVENTNPIYRSKTSRRPYNDTYRELKQLNDDRHLFGTVRRSYTMSLLPFLFVGILWIPRSFFF